MSFSLTCPLNALKLDFNDFNNIKGVPYDGFEPGVNCHIVNFEVSGNEVKLYIVATKEELLDRYIKGVPDGMELIYQNNDFVQDIVMPEPEFLYAYEPTELTCNHCGQSFDHTELRSDSFLDGDYEEHFVDDICPNCGEGFCCEYEYEKIGDVEACLRFWFKNDNN